MKQVEGTKSNEILQKKIKQVGNKTLFEGAIASCVVTLIGHYPWFVVHNYLNKYKEAMIKGNET